jgi:dihydroxy-acid dehydratase
VKSITELVVSLVRLLVDMMFRGWPAAVIAELLKNNALPHPDAMTVSGKTMGQNCEGDFTSDPRVIFPFTKPLKASAGFLNLKGTLFDSAIMKTSVISPAFTEQYLSNPDDPMAFEGPVAVFDGPEDYHHRIETDKSITAGTILIIRGAGPVGYPGAAEVVNMIPPGHLIKQGIEVCSIPSPISIPADKHSYHA